jgi:hypothetical protein
VELLIVRRETFGFQSRRSPRVLKIEEVSGRKGDGAPAVAGDPGLPGTVIRSNGDRYIHPIILASVLAYARLAYRNGWRDKAEEILRPYYEELAETQDSAPEDLPEELVAMRTELIAMRSNMENNLDYFGNPVGWLPRLNVTTNFANFERERANSFRMLWFATRLLDKWDQLNHEQAFTRVRTEAVAEEVALAQDVLQAALQNLRPARDALSLVTAELQQVEARLITLNRRFESIAIEHVERRRLVEGFLMVAGGLMQAIPVGQPYLGMAGETVSLLADFSFEDEAGNFSWVSAGDSFGTFTEELSKRTEGFLKQHKETEKAQRDKGLRREVKDAEGAIRLLDDQVDKVNAKITARWESMRQPELDDLERQIAEYDAAIAQIASDEAEEQARLELAQMTAAERARTIRKQDLDQAHARLQRELAQVKADADEQAAARKAELQDQLSKLASLKTDQQKGIADLKEKAEDAKSRSNQALQSLSRLGDGIAGIGAGVRHMLQVVDAEDPAVVALMADVQASPLLDDETKKEMRDVMARINEINERKTAAAMDLLRIQQTVSNASALISNNLGEMIALSHDRQRLSGALNLATRGYIERMRRRAQERMQQALYAFVRAYRYEFLRDVSNEFYEFTTWVDRINGLLEGDTEVPTEAQFEEIEKTLLAEQYLEMAANIVKDRQHYARENRNHYEMELTPEMLQTLSTKGEVTFNMVEDLGRGNFGMNEWRIMNIKLNNFEIETDNDNISINID